MSDLPQNTLNLSSEIPPNKPLIAHYSFATVVIIGFFSTLAALIFYTIPVENKTAVEMTLGVLGTLVITIINYFFGSSSGSQSKEEILRNVIVNK